MIKLIFLDIDGTLLNDEKKITSKTLEVLLRAQEKGCKLVLASGRCNRGLKRFADELKMDKHGGYLVCFNGSQVRDYSTDEILYNKPMSIEESKAVLHHMKNFNVWPMVIKDSYMHVSDVYGPSIKVNEKPIMEYESRSNNYLLCEEKDLEEYCNFPLNKILVIGEPEYLKKHYEEMAKPFEGSLNSMFTAPYYYEYTALGVDKAKGIKEAFIDKLNYKQEEMIAFGDQMNDLSMLEICGVGVAMGNAVKDVKEKADYITASNNEDGIASALLHFLF